MEHILMPKELTAENGAKYLLNGEFKESITVDCPECDGTGEEPNTENSCDECDGMGEIVTNN